METNMKQAESKDSRSSWLAGNLKKMDRNVKQMRKMIDDRPDLATHVEDFYHMYQTLAERYDLLTGELQKNEQSDFQQEGSGYAKSGSGEGSPLLIPDHKRHSHKTGSQAASSTSGGSSDFSLKEGTELSLSSSSDSESESSNSSVKIHLDAPIDIACKELDKKVTEEEEKESYEELLRRVTKYEDKLRVSNLRLQLCEEEVASLKCEIHSQIESAKKEIKMREDDLEMERREMLELQTNISESETRVSESNFEIKKLMKELDVNRERLKGSDEEIKRIKNELAIKVSEVTLQLQGQLKLAQDDVVMLNAKLDSERVQVLTFQERIARYESNLSDRDSEVAELKVALSDAAEKFSLERTQLQSTMFSLLEKQALSDERLKEWELQGKALEDKIGQCEAEKMEMKCLHEARESGMQSVIGQLKVEASERVNHVEALNKNMDSLKLKYDMLMAEKDEVNAKVNTLMAEAISRDNHFGQIEEHFRKLKMEHGELIGASETTRKLVAELRLRVKELEDEVDRQRVFILEGAEEKKEAIRQLCFTLEHYRSGYQELRQAFIGYKRPSVMAS